MDELSFKPDGYCGLYCAACPSYLATQIGDFKELGLAECKGCKSHTVTGEWCKDCPLKKCAQKKGLEFCSECDEYPCDALEKFKTDKQFPYHSEVYDYMKYITEKGKEAWLKKMKKRWHCKICGEPFDWWTNICSECGAETKGYLKPVEK